MKKAKVLQPKYDFGHHVLFNLPTDQPINQARKLGQVEKVQINMTPEGGQVLYGVHGHDDEMVAEERIVRRIVV